MGRCVWSRHAASCEPRPQHPPTPIGSEFSADAALTGSTRREFLLRGVGAVAGLAATSLVSGCAQTGKGQTEAPLPRRAPADGRRSLVAAGRGDDLGRMTADALAALGGIGKVVRSGESVFIKPNMVTLPFASASYDPFRAGECAKPDIVVAVAEACLAAGASKVTIGDGSQMPTFDWSKARTMDGRTDLVKEAARLESTYGKPVSLACLDSATTEWVRIPSRTSLKAVTVSGLVIGADRVISIPVAKSHKWAYATLSLKNFVGITPLRPYGWTDAAGSNFARNGIHAGDPTPDGFGRLHLDIAKAAQIDLAVIDFSICVEGDGPTLSSGGSTVDVKNRLGAWLVLASTDPVAADATAARLMGEQRYINHVLHVAESEGMGIARDSAIDIAGGTLADLRIPAWQPATIA